MIDEKDKTNWISAKRSTLIPSKGLLTLFLFDKDESIH